MEGLGQLSLLNFWAFEERMKETEDKVAEYCKTASKPNPLLFLLVTSMKHALSRLRCLKSAFGQMRFGVTEVQCYYLEIYALLDYLQIYKPRMDGAQPAATVANCIGGPYQCTTCSPRFYDNRFACLADPPLEDRSLPIQFFTSCYS